MTSPILELDVRGKGLAVRYQHGKRPFEQDCSKSPPKNAAELRWEYRDGDDIGFRAGA